MNTKQELTLLLTIAIVVVTLFGFGYWAGDRQSPIDHQEQTMLHEWLDVEGTSATEESQYNLWVGYLNHPRGPHFDHTRSFVSRDESARRWEAHHSTAVASREVFDANEFFNTCKDIDSDLDDIENELKRLRDEAASSLINRDK
jgi:hypothetical protein